MSAGPEHQPGLKEIGSDTWAAAKKDVFRFLFIFETNSFIIIGASRPNKYQRPELT